MSDIKNCPFCGGEAFYWEDRQYQDCHVIECGNCGTTRRSEYGYDDVLRDWNRRYDSNGKEVIGLPAPMYRPIVIARMADTQYDMPVWLGNDLLATEEDAKEVADEMSKRFFLASAAQVVTEGT